MFLIVDKFADFSETDQIFKVRHKIYVFFLFPVQFEGTSLKIKSQFSNDEKIAEKPQMSL